MGTTGIEITDLIADVFGPSGADRSGFLASTAAHGAAPHVLGALERRACIACE